MFIYPLTYWVESFHDKEQLPDGVMVARKILALLV